MSVLMADVRKIAVGSRSSGERGWVARCGLREWADVVDLRMRMR